jgi:hypothetical protein
VDVPDEFTEALDDAKTIVELVDHTHLQRDQTATRFVREVGLELVHSLQIHIVQNAAASASLRHMKKRRDDSAQRSSAITEIIDFDSLVNAVEHGCEVPVELFRTLSDDDRQVCHAESQFVD